MYEVLFDLRYWALNDKKSTLFQKKKKQKQQNKTSPAIKTSNPLTFVGNLCIYKLFKLTVEIVLKGYHYPHHFDESCICLAVCNHWKSYSACRITLKTVVELWKTMISIFLWLFELYYVKWARIQKKLLFVTLAVGMGGIWIHEMSSLAVGYNFLLFSICRGLCQQQISGTCTGHWDDVMYLIMGQH